MHDPTSGQHSGNQELLGGQGNILVFRRTVSTLWFTGSCLGAMDQISEVYKYA